MKVIMQFNLPDEALQVEQAFKAGIAWAALWSADNRLRNALKHLDDPEQFRDAMIEIRELIQDALGKIDE
jgi:hypothetical protein